MQHNQLPDPPSLIQIDLTTVGSLQAAAASPAIYTCYVVRDSAGRITPPMPFDDAFSEHLVMEWLYGHRPGYECWIDTVELTTCEWLLVGRPAPASITWPTDTDIDNAPAELSELVTTCEHNPLATPIRASIIRAILTAGGVQTSGSGSPTH